MWPTLEIIGTVSRRLIVRPSLCTRDSHRTCTCTGWWTRCALHGYRDLFRAHALWEFTAMMRFVQAISVRGKVVSSAQHNLPRLAMSHHKRDWTDIFVVYRGMGSLKKYILRVEQAGTSRLSSEL